MFLTHHSTPFDYYCVVGLAIKIWTHKDGIPLTRMTFLVRDVTVFIAYLIDSRDQPHVHLSFGYVSCNNWFQIFSLFFHINADVTVH
jgi:hypothetical protein